MQCARKKCWSFVGRLVAWALLFAESSGSRNYEEEDTTMNPATIPGFPVTIFPGLLFPSPLAGMSTVDVTAAVAVFAWALGGLVALRIAIAMSRDADRPRHVTEATPTHPSGFRDAA
jgi:hypothetical protein